MLDPIHGPIDQKHLVTRLSVSWEEKRVGAAGRAGRGEVGRPGRGQLSMVRAVQQGMDRWTGQGEQEGRG